MVTFPLVDEPDVSLLAWTTTPWTLPSNLGLCVNPSLEYVKIQDKATGNVYVLMEKRLEQLYKDPRGKDKAKYEVLEKFPGSKLVGRRYTPLFQYFADHEGAFVVASDGYVTDDSGTGIVHQVYQCVRHEHIVRYAGGTCASTNSRVLVFIVRVAAHTLVRTAVVHRCGAMVTDGSQSLSWLSGLNPFFRPHANLTQAPAFGEDDYRVMMEHGVIKKGGKLPCPVDDSGKFTAEVTDFVGQHVKDADKDIIKMLKQMGRLVLQSNYSHNYPFCWRYAP